MTFEIFYKRNDRLNDCGKEDHPNAETAIKSIKQLFLNGRNAFIDVALEGTNRLIVSRPK